ncbi:acyl-CoA dehydrogenase family protein [uncultured Phenylobacterium sp.]|uniref:acyl-CoA dehydrogenase family protein n=1 Tax=uncultured Phenylobacterium sp. TaxID=349273 RepID=UPI0025E957F7|nr:acyl-CoA dehydrogenase family protein [uncultured Phenylobacterium sp.]
MADFGGDVETFRTEVRDWLEANFPKALAGKPELQLAKLQAQPETPEATAWRKALGAKGWGVPHWPKEVGGGGLSREQIRVLQEEMAKIGARNPIGGMGVTFFGPTLLEYGSEALKKEHFPGIVSGDVWWCQGYSEPGAGSDLASLACRAEDKGDHFLVNGSKIWTSGAQHADRCYCLVRTDTSKKHEGISFLLIDMKDPGVTIKPIHLINGTAPFCEMFFTDVKVPKDQLWGPLNGGWTVAKRLMMFERDSIAGSLGGGNIGQTGPVQTIPEAAKERLGVDETGRLNEPDLRRRITDHLMENRTFQLTMKRAADDARASNGPSNTAAIMKYAGAKIAMERNELMLESLGLAGLGWEGDGFAEQELGAVRSWLRSKANSIEGGTSEINLNIVAKRVLGLPDPK